jgi:hypothetical protein
MAVKKNGIGTFVDVGNAAAPGFVAARPTIGHPGRIARRAGRALRLPAGPSP